MVATASKAVHGSHIVHPLTGLTGSSPPVHRNMRGVGGSWVLDSSARAASNMTAACDASSAAPVATRVLLAACHQRGCSHSSKQQASWPIGGR